MTDKWNGQTVLVTGAGGFIGSRLVEKLTLNGARVRAFVRYTSRAEVGLLRQLPPEILTNIEVCVSKVRDQGKKEEVPIQLVFTQKQKKGTSNDYNSHS